MKAVITSLLVSTVAVFYAQCPSAESISKDKTKTKEKNPYSINSQSRSGSIAGDKEYEMSFIAQPGMDYRLTTKAANPAAGTITYEVYEMVVEKKVENGKEEFKRVKHVLASSSNTGGQPLEFTTDKTRKIFVAVNLSGGDTKKPQCVGVLIEDKRSTKLGF